MLKSFVALLGSLAFVNAQRECTVPFGGPGINDSPAILTTLASCGNDSVVTFMANTTYNISTPVNFGVLENVTISILGNLDLPRDINYTQGIVNASGGTLTWLTLSGNNNKIAGGSIPGWSIINAYGQGWWDLAPVTLPLGGIPNRPHLMSISGNNTELRDFTIKPIAWGISIKGDGSYVHDIVVDARYDLDNPSVFPFNTDGWDATGDNLLFERLHVANGDDCVAVNGGNNITIRDSECWGGHGMSVSATNGVSNVLFDNITMSNELYATRFKSSLDSVGNITNVTWSNIYVENCTFGVFATGVYFDQNTNRGMVPGVYPANSTATHISNFRWENISGSINDMYPGDGSCVTDPCWYYVANVTANAAVTLQLLNQTATNITLSNINLAPIDGKVASGIYCTPDSFVDGTSDLGYDCDIGVLTKA